MNRFCTIVLIFAGILGLAYVIPTSFTMTHKVQLARPFIAPKNPDAKPILPRLPRLRPKLYLFTQPGCAPCARLKTALQDPALKEDLARFDFEEVSLGGPLWKKFKITATPTLIAVGSNGLPKIQTGALTLGQLKAWLASVDELSPASLWTPLRSTPLWRAIEKFVVGGSIGPDGQQIVTDMPESLRMRNVGGRDGAGLCVFTSINHSARWQNERRLWNFQQDMRKERGGGWPEKVDQMIPKYGKGTPYLQYEGRDPSILELALKTGRMPGVTYSGRDGVFYRGPIAHMVNLVYLDAKDAAILDNNNPDKILWMSRSEFLSRWTGGSSGWAVILLAPRPPPAPKN